MNNGLSAEQNKAICKVLSQHTQISEARLYGSRALGRYRSGSDIDLTLLGEIDLPTLNRISLELDDLLLPWEIDLSAYALIDNPDLLDHIRRVGQVFYRKKEQH
ncbi:MAG: hypothetical protein COB51_12945 [Moraxellaceae bacterium]|nr:MAG: hypothetical protein COB51_12945 [Moraxellaceae bacterium]